MVTRQNETITNYTFNAAGQFTDLTHDLGGDSIDVFHYYYDPVGVRDSLEDLAGDKHTFTYDDIYQLTDVDRPIGFPAGDEFYRYDGVGNRTNSHLSSSYTHDEVDRLTSDDNCSYSWDDAGRMIRRVCGATEDFAYSVDGQLLEIRNSTTGVVVNYDYDGVGNRIRKIVDDGRTTTTIKYTHDGADLLFEHDDTDAVQIRYLYGPGIDHILESEVSGHVYQHFADALGSVAKITDNDGTEVKSMTYDSFGNIVAETGGADAEEISYTGRERESEFGLYYYRARYYDPLTGRFMVRDPLGLAAGDANLYRYVGNNPANFYDPYGLYSWRQLAYDVGTFWVGVGDASSFGLTSWIRSLNFYGESYVNTCSGWYTGGRVVGFTASSYLAGAGIARGLRTVRGIVRGTARVSPRTPIGGRGIQFRVNPGTNAPANIGGRTYTGHALDMMQQRGIMQSVVEDAIQFGTRAPGNIPGRYVYSSENVQVVVNALGDIITVIPK